MDVDSGRVDSRHGHFCASGDRSGHTERKDSWNDDGSPDAHGSSVANFPGQQARLSGSARSWGVSMSSGVLSASGHFMHACNRYLKTF